MEVKFFRFGQDRLAFDVSNVALFEVDEEGASALRGSRVDGEAVAELRDFQQRGFFRGRPSPGQVLVPTNVRSRIQSITFGLTHECNLRCSYCFGQRYLQSEPEPDAQMLAVGRACLQLLHENWRRGLEAVEPRAGAAWTGCADVPPHASFSLIFFGGEPLLRFDVLRSLVEYGRALFHESPDRLTFGLTTNALPLDEEKAIWLREKGITPLVSVDGFGEAHDFYRRDATGNGSFQRLRRNLEKARRVGLPYGARVTITNQNVDLVGTMRQLDPLGFFSYKFCPLCGQDQYALTPANQRRLARSIHELGDLFLQRLRDQEKIRFDAFDHCLDSLANCRAMPWCCDAGANEISVNPLGEIFSCYKLAGEPEARMGHVWDDSLWAYRPNLDYADRVEHIDACSQCWIRYVCSGGCFADRHVSAKYGETRCFDNHCQLNRVLTAEAIRVYQQASRRCPDLLERFLRKRS